MKRLVYLLPILFCLIASCDQDNIFDEAEQLRVDVDLIENYLSENNLVADTLRPSEIRIVVNQEGTGPKPEFGSTVIVDYRGYLLDGTEFDSSIGLDPIDVVIGRGDVIQGWEIALQEMNAGTMATIFIPSGFGYGNNRQGLFIPPNSVLVFDIQVLDVR
ncbi:FKBP-type peptidyl-prolyl cis-trans isomerase [Roseivirga sp. E12]|uniref:FKBP-type peptidyl-prolyl cis-trans isomerase n=1 Tax=Roseivirga sp. E12 TaxID=2819237 RepID=UPI001ABBF4AA|nr:FKBP-type peptidyl-prolyl cis-trans isomerase [Roseivirga sp. E12]MBO3699384.1 FKBP-type peptidyl-prolyl cis-trans isomerase [Roseivirga sp. E12]